MSGSTFNFEFSRDIADVVEKGENGLIAKYRANKRVSDATNEELMASKPLCISAVVAKVQLRHPI